VTRSPAPSRSARASAIRVSRALGHIASSSPLSISTGPAACSKAISALATRLATDGRALRIYDVKLATPTSQTTHTHAVPTVAVLINGIIMSEGPDAQAKALAPAPVGLKRLDAPGQWVLVPRGETHTVVRLGNVDARLLEIEVR